MQIRIVSGGYGYKENGRNRLMTPSSPPFSVDDAEGARLIGLGVAARADGSAEDRRPDTDAASAAELRAMCEARGIRPGKRATAQAMRDLLAAADADAEMPTLTAADPVTAV